MENSETKQRWINRPFVKGFLAGIVVLAACNLSQPFLERFDPSVETSTFGGIFFNWILSIGVPIAILFIFGWITNKVLSRFGFEGFKASDEWQFGAVPGCLAGGVVYMILAAIVIFALSGAS